MLENPLWGFSSMMALPQESLIALSNLRIVTYFRVASVSAYVYDYFLTLPREVSLIWPAPWTAIKILFLLTRYIPFIDGALQFYYRFQQHHHTAKSCDAIFKATSWLILIGMGMPQIILTLRTWAVWNRDRRLSIGLSIFFVVCYLPVTVIVFLFLQSIVVTPLTSPVLLGCAMTKASHIIGGVWILMFIYHAGLFSLMLIRGIQCYRRGANSGMFHVVFRNGLLYYIIIFGISLTNTVVVITVTPSLQTFFITLEHVVFAIIGCRVILDIRDQLSNASAPSRISPPHVQIVRTSQTSTLV